MKFRILSFISAFIISVNTIFSMSLQVHASDDLSGYDNWTFEQQAYYFFEHFASTFFGAVGLLVSRGSNAEALIKSLLQGCYDDLQVEDCTYEEWLSYRLGVQTNDAGENELIVDDELSDLMYQAANIYIEEYCGWYEIDTLDYKTILASSFQTQGLYQSFIGYCTKNIKGTDNMFSVYNYNGYISSTDDNGAVIYNYYTNATDVYSNVEYYVSTPYLYTTQNWETFYPNIARIFEDGSIDNNVGTSGSLYFTETGYTRRPITDGVRTIRVYKTLEDLKNYSVGQRPYYYTSKFQDYDVNGDNSCIISESDLNNSSVYGDVVNNIITIYEDADGLTEDELRAILDEYFDDDDDDDGSNSGGSSSSGSGLSDFIDGLGSIGDAIMSILGKLLEYVGKAIDLLSGTVTKVIDLIPQNITNLLSGLFPFLPEEWLVAIELSLVLAVIVGIVGLFKK